MPASGTQKLQLEAGERMRPGALRIQAGHAKRLCSTRCAAECRLALRRGATGLLLLTTTPSALPLDRLVRHSPITFTGVAMELLFPELSPSLGLPPCQSPNKVSLTHLAHRRDGRIRQANPSR